MLLPVGNAYLLCAPLQHNYNQQHQLRHIVYYSLKYSAIHLLPQDAALSLPMLLHCSSALSDWLLCLSRSSAVPGESISITAEMSLNKGGA